MRIGKISSLLVLSLAVGGIGIGAGPAFASSGPHAVAIQKVHVKIVNATTPAGSQGAYVGSSGVGSKILFTAHLGKKVVLTVDNQSFMDHNFVSRLLGANKMVTAGSTVTITFTPKKAGLIKWDCPAPCGDWVMSHMGYMEGYVKVLAK